MIYILGGRGFVGSAYSRWCERTRAPYTVIDRSNYEWLVHTKCDLLINANGNSSKVLARDQPLADFDASVRSVHKSLLDFKSDRYVFLSSCDVYPDCSRQEITLETARLDVSRQSCYGLHKFLAEQIVISLHSSWLIFRLGGFVGPGLRKNPIFDILFGGTLWMDPRSELQFIHTDAAAEVVMNLALGSVRNEIFNLCGDGAVCLGDVIKASGRQVAVVPECEVVRYNVSVEKLKRHMSVPKSAQTISDFVARRQ